MSDNTHFVPNDNLITTPEASVRKAKHPAAGRLFISWSLSTAVQQASGMWPVRADIPVQGGYLPLSSYNTSPEDFADFMHAGSGRGRDFP